MSDEPENLVLHHLRELRKDINERLDKIDDKLGRLGSDVEEVGLAVASLSVSNRHIRADVSKILANQEQHEARIKRIEEHLRLTEA